MVNFIWFFLISIGITLSLLTGKFSLLNDTILTSPNNGFELILDIAPLIILWTGIMKIAEDSGLLIKFSKFLYPVLSKLFPSVPKNNKSLGYIASNVAANMMGLGSAATPFGLKAMTELQKINPKKDTASTPMITFLVLNTAGVTVIPTTILALRTMMGSTNPSIIIIPAVLATTASSITALTIDYILRKKNKHE